jgi:hypothetical protein
VEIGKKAYEKIVALTFQSLEDLWKTKSFFDLDLEKISTNVLGKLSETLEKIHTNFTTKIETACLQKIVAGYVTMFLSFAEKKKLKKDDVR